jgi:Multiubiquitin
MSSTLVDARSLQTMHTSAQDLNEQHATERHEKTVEILVNTKPVEVPDRVTGAEIKTAAKVPPDFRLFRVHGREEIPVGDDEPLHVHHHERFVASPSLDPAFLSNPTHADAVNSVRDAFPGHSVDVGEAGDGTTTVVIRDVEIGSGWSIPTLDLRVKLQVTFPSSPPYPFYGPAGLSRSDGSSFAQLQPHVLVDGEVRTQISLTKTFDPTVETLGARLVAVVAWLRDPR